MLADYVFAALYFMCVSFEEQESPHRAQRSLRTSLLECLWLAHWCGGWEKEHLMGSSIWSLLY